ncbi:MAG: ABC transporter permease [Candidatus Sumerlaeaceae bacterium]
MKYLLLTWSNLKRKKLRTLLTLFSIVVAFILFGLLAAIHMALVGGVQFASKDRMITRHKISIIQLLPQSYKARIERLPGVVSAVHQTWFGGYYQDPKNFFMQCPVVPEEFFAMFPELIITPEHMKAWLATRTGAIVGKDSAERYGWKIGDNIPIFSPLWSHDGNSTWEFDMVGLYEGRHKGTDDTALFFRHDYFEEARNWGKGLVGWYSIKVKDLANSARIAAAIDKEFENSPAETKTEPEGAMAQSFVKQMGNITLIIAAIMAAVFFTILLVSGNTMAQAVRERTGELGVLKAIGFTNRQVMSLVLLESCLLAVLGGVIGLGLAYAITSRGDPTNGMLPLFFLPVRDVLIGLAISLGLGLVTGIFPAMQALRLRVADALRRM